MTSLTALHQRLQIRLRSLVGANLAVACSGVDGDPELLWPQERSAVAKAIPRRQREFAAGRATARAAMRELGWRECAIPAREDRSPDWPEGLVGSISHSSSCCVVVLGIKRHWDSLGVDVEQDQSVEPELWPSICQPEELHALSNLETMARKSRVTRLFSAKEAFFKWQYPATRQMLDFQDVAIRLDPDDSSFEAFCSRDHPALRLLGSARGFQLLVEGQIFSMLASSRAEELARTPTSA